MSNFETLRKQVHVNDERQILSPSELFEGAQIAVLQVFPGASRKERLMQAAFSLTGAVGDQANGKIKAAKQGWNHFGLKGLAPMFIGLVKWVDSSRAQVDITAEPNSYNDSLSFVGADLEELPALETPIVRTLDLSELGLTAIQPVITGFRPEPQIANVGRWQPHATILLHEEH